jgi:hypothetical protein
VDPVRNPFAPGAGNPPPELAGRQAILDKAELGESPHRSGEVADKLGVKVQSVAPTRSSLIQKGMIYSPQHGDRAFTVPLFDDFLKRQIQRFP